MSKAEPKIGLVLSSGGARGLAHIGVIKSLVENQIPIDLIAGTSIGAAIGGAYASHKSIDLIEKVYLAIDRKRIIHLSSDINLLSGGLLEGRRLTEFIANKLGCAHDFKNIQIPFSAIATNLKTKEFAVLNSGNLPRSIRASASFPGVLKPVEIGHNIYLDGGLSNPVPVDVARDMGADIIIAVYLEKSGQHSNNSQKKTKKSLMNNLISSVHIMQKSLADRCVDGADIVIRPSVGHIFWNQFIDGKKLINEGYQAANLAMPTIKKFLQII